jgi:hypothetical protein
MGIPVRLAFTAIRVGTNRRELVDGNYEITLNRFLAQTNVHNEKSAMHNALGAALQRNPTYTPGASQGGKT